jgi:HD-GYP domain-containing protein (c-di-GMP phosphodiesterase class II)
MSVPAEKHHKRKIPYFPIRINSVATGIPLPFDIYLFVNDKPTLFRKHGDVITPERMKLLYHHGGDQFLVPDEQRADYLNSLKSIIRDPSTSTEMKSRFIKESAFIHVQDLFTKENLTDVVNDAHSLVEEMVNFVSTDVEAVATLMRLSVHDYYTYNHCVDVAVYSIALAKRIFGDDKQLLLVAGLGGLLHDIGKRRIDLKVINKNTPLTPEEWEEIKRHPTYGKDLLETIPSLPDPSRLVVFEHHENFDGTGYPRGLKEEEISKLARVVTIADVFDALTTNRSYHKAISPTEALNTMFAMQPGKFDPNIFKSFNKNFATKSRFLLPHDFDPCQPPPVKIAK